MRVFILVRHVYLEESENKGVFLSQAEAETAYKNRAESEVWDGMEVQEWEVGKGRIS